MPANNYPSYLYLYSTGELKQRVEAAYEILNHCTLCPWKCGVNRLIDEKGQCQTGRLARVYSYAPHFGEERPISGTKGSGTIFFSGCNLHCVFCQNADISQEMYGMEVTDERLARMMLELQSRGCHNINLVSPTHIIPQILGALLHAIESGFNLPLVYNTGGYDAAGTLSLLEGIIDIYMPDMKYADAEKAKRFSGVPNYPTKNQFAVKEMYRQVGNLVLDNNGVAKSGLLIRHLVMPMDIGGTGEVLQFIANEISADTYINIMDQFHPAYHARQHKEINRRVSKAEFQAAVDKARVIGLTRIDHLIIRATFT